MSDSGTASSIERVEPRRLLVQLRGALDEYAVQQISDGILRRLHEIGPGGELIIDMHELESCTTEGRMRLIELQRNIAKLTARTAFVTNRPRFRGVALYVAHHSDDTSARAFHLSAQADAWLRRSDGRIESISAYFQRNKQGNSKAPRRSSDELVARVAKLRDSSDDEGAR